jgi:hypothetical protein
MSNIVQFRDVTEWPKEPRLPAFPPEWEVAIKQFLEPDWRAGPPATRMPAATHAGMQALCEAWDPAFDPAPITLVTRWLRELAAAGLANGPTSREDLTARAGAVAFVCNTLPAWAFNANTLRQALATLKFFPTPANVLELLTAHCRPTVSRLKALRAIVKAGPRVVAEPEAPTEDERQAVRRLLAEVRGGLRAAEVARQSISTRPQMNDRPRTAHLTPDQLRAARAELVRSRGG